MTTKAEIQALLRFLSQDAKVPLPTALAKVKDLQGAQLTTPESIARASITTIQPIFVDEKQAKSVLAAAKRVTKKRSAGEPDSPSPSKRMKSNVLEESESSPASIEASLALPATSAGEDEVASTIVHTNRAPLVLAFAFTLLKYTMPSQPISSRFSLAQAVVSVNSRSKAVSLGIAEKGTGAEDEGWGMGQPGVKIMGREVKVMRRHGYNAQEGDDLADGKLDNQIGEVKEKMIDSQATLKQEDTGIDEEPALWGLDLEALRSSNGPLVPGAQNATGAGLPIYRAQNARVYLLKSFASPPQETIASSARGKKSTPATQKVERGENLARILVALDLLHASWAHVLPKDELDRRSWSWYVAVRPEVKDGVAGWGGKGEVSLRKILGLRRKG